MAFVRSYLTALFLPVFHSFLWLLFILPLGMDTNLLSNCCWNTERTSTLKTGLVINGGAREVLVYYYYYHYYSHVNLSKMTNWIDLAILTAYIPLQKRAHSKTSIVKMQISEKWRQFSVNQEISWVYPFPGYCSCSDIRNICLFFDEE